MHILFEENGFPCKNGWQGGAGTYVKIVADELIRNQHSVTIIMGEDPDVEEEYRIENGITIYPINYRSRFLWYISRLPIIKIFYNSLEYLYAGFIKYQLIKKIHDKMPIDLIEYSDGGDFWQSIFKKIPYICHLHGPGFTVKRHLVNSMKIREKIRRALECFFIANARLVVSPSKRMIQLVEDEYGRKFKNVKSIVYPLSEFKIPTERLSINSNKLKFFMSGRPDLTKGWIVLLDAIKTVNISHKKQVDFILYGHEQIDLEYRCPENVIIYPFSHRENVLKSIKTCDVAIVPSFFDNSPNSIYEAMAMGIPVIGSNVGGIPELVIHNKTGLLFNNKSVLGLAKCILYFINNPDKVIELGNNAYDMIVAKSELYINYRKRMYFWKKAII